MGKSVPHNLSKVWILDPAILPGTVNSYVLSWAEQANCTANKSKRSSIREGQVGDDINLRDRGFKRDQPASHPAH